MVNPAYTPEIKALECRTALAAKWRAKPVEGLRYTKKGQTLVFEREPAFILNKEGAIVGVDAWVRLFENGVEVPIDNHRRIVNVPRVPESGIEVIRAPNPETGDAGERVLTPNPELAFVEAVWGSVLRTPHAKGWQGPEPFREDARGTVTTVYADASDGRILSQNATYATARTGGTLTASNNGQLVAGQAFNGSLYTCHESFVSYDTSVIGDSDTIDDVVQSLDGSADSSVVDFTVNARLQNWGAGVTTADWVSGASLAALTLLATLATSSYSAGYNAFTSEAAFVSNINKTGFTFIILTGSRHENGDVPTASGENVIFEDAEGGTTVGPKLDITHTAPAGPAITDVDPDTFSDADTGIDVTGTAFQASQGTGTVELGDNATYASANKQAQTVTSWGDTAIVFTAVLGSLTPGSLWVFVTDDAAATSAGFAVSVAAAGGSPVGPLIGGSRVGGWLVGGRLVR